MRSHTTCTILPSMSTIHDCARRFTSLLNTPEKNAGLQDVRALLQDRHCNAVLQPLQARYILQQRVPEGCVAGAQGGVQRAAFAGAPDSHAPGLWQLVSLLWLLPLHATGAWLALAALCPRLHRLDCAHHMRAHWLFIYIACGPTTSLQEQIGFMCPGTIRSANNMVQTWTRRAAFRDTPAVNFER